MPTTTMPKNALCLWYDEDAEEAARFYAQTFPTARSARCTGRRPTSRAARRATC